MTNTNKTFFTIISFSAPRIIKDYYNLVASSHYLSSVEKEDIISNSALFEKFKMLYDSSLKIVIIDNKFKEFSSNKVGNSISDDITIFKIPEYLFFDKKGIEEVLIKNKKISKFIFIFKNKDYRDIVYHLALYNIIVSGGSNTKKHILSPVQLRLARFLIALLPLTGNNVTNSFHTDRIDKTSGYDFTSKKGREILSHFTDTKIKVVDTKNTNSNESPENTQDLTNGKATGDKAREGGQESRNNREFHTISCLQIDKTSFNSIEIAPIPVKPLANTTNGDKSQRVSSTILSYLDSIQSIINNPENTPEKAQSLIENSWMSILLAQLNDEKKLINKYSHRFSKVLLEANITLNSLQENNVIKKKFPLLYKDLNSINFIFITYSLCISYSNRFGYTSLAELVGNNILYLLYKKNECIPPRANLKDFKNQVRASKIISYKLGDFFITLLTQFPHDLFERNLSSSSYYTKEVAILNINSEYLEDIKNNIIVHPYTLPMICKPNIWSEDFYGGFLDNINKEVSIITGSNRHKHLVENKEALFKTINNLNSIKFSVNNTLLDYLQNEGKFLLDFIKEENKLQRDIILKIAESFSNVPFYLNVHAD